MFTSHERVSRKFHPEDRSGNGPRARRWTRILKYSSHSSSYAHVGSGCLLAVFRKHEGERATSAWPAPRAGRQPLLTASHKESRPPPTPLPTNQPFACLFTPLLCHQISKQRLSPRSLTSVSLEANHRRLMRVITPTRGMRVETWLTCWLTRRVNTMELWMEQ